MLRWLTVIFSTVTPVLLTTSLLLAPMAARAGANNAATSWSSVQGEKPDRFSAVATSPAATPEPQFVGNGEGGFGSALATHGDRVLIGALTAGSSGEGAAFIYRRDSGDWSLEARLEAPKPHQNAFFGGSVALSGANLAVGAWGEDAVYLYRYGASGWSLSQVLRAAQSNGTTRHQHFGMPLLLIDDLLVVGAAHQGAEPVRSGAVHLYRLGAADNRWEHWQQLAPAGVSSGGLFGTSLAMSGKLLAVGASQDDPSARASGAVYLFEVGDSALTPIVRIAPPQGATAYSFGSAVALDGELLVVSAPGEDYGGYRSSSVFVYRGAGSSWLLVDRLESTAGSDQRFGASLAIVGKRIIVGQMTDNDFESGGVCVLLFEPEGGRWRAQPAVLFDEELFGLRYLSLSGSNQELLIGYPVQNDSGATFKIVFPRSRQ